MTTAAGRAATASQTGAARRGSTGDDGVESYVHRIGRTARGGAKGESLTFWVDKTDRKQAGQLVKLLRDAGQEVPSYLDEAASSGRGGKGDGHHHHFW